MDIKAYVDNSVLTVLRENGGAEHVEFSLAVMKKYNIVPEHCIITDRLFLELIDKGGIRRKIVNNADNKKRIEQEKNKFYSTDSLQEGVENYTLFLEEFFTSKIEEVLPQNCLCCMAEESLLRRPFIQEFHSFEKDIISYAKEIAESRQRYQSFISTLVVDSIIKYLFFDRRIKDFDKDFSQKALNTLAIRHQSMTVLHNNLMLLSACYKWQGESKDKKKLFGLDKDFADVEPQALLFFGAEINGVNYPITFLTYEKINMVRDRLENYFNAAIAAKYFVFHLGRTIVINRDFKGFEEIPSYSFVLHKNFYEYYCDFFCKHCL